MSDLNLSKTFIAGGAITEYALVSFDGNGKVVVTTAGSDAAVIGVAQTAKSAGEAVSVVIFGETRVIASGSITFVSNPILSATTAGQVQAVASSEYPVCRILPSTQQTSAAAGEQIKVHFFGPSLVKP
jgi:hypothetical protein